MKMRPETARARINNYWNRVEDGKNSYLNYPVSKGHVVTPYGIVAVYSSGFYLPRTALEIVKDGIIHEKEYRDYFESEQLGPMALEFAKEIFELK